MIEYKNTKVIQVQDWDKLVQSTYGKPYNFQQQEGCQERGQFHITIPCKETNEEEMNDSIPEIVNGEEMGVKFNVWLARNPRKHLKDEGEGKGTKWMIDLFWYRNFYPDIYTVANDLYEKGLIKAGDYTINIDW